MRLFSKCLFALATLGTVACGGARKPGDSPGETLFWRVTSSDMALSQCTDAPNYWDDVKPVEFNESTYLIYRLEPDGKKATTMQCSSLMASSCTPNPSGLVFDVAGPELFFSKESKSPIGTEGCQVQTAQSWLMVDEGQSLRMTVTNVLALVDNPTACDAVEARLKSASPNQTGLRGCVLTFTVGAVLDP